MIYIGGLQKMTLIDYLGKVAASVFLAGCNFKCGFCHNPDLIQIQPEKKYLSQQDFFDFLNKRKKILEGICVSGGEPLIHSNLAEFLEKIKDLDLLIKLDTNGSNPEFLKQLIAQGLVDYLAMDIKGSFDKYENIVKTKIDLNKIKKSIALIMNCGLDYEFRTTLMPKFHTLADLHKIGKIITGANAYYLQRFNNAITYDPEFVNENSFTDKELDDFKQIATQYVKICQLRP